MSWRRELGQFFERFFWSIELRGDLKYWKWVSLTISWAISWVNWAPWSQGARTEKRMDESSCSDHRNMFGGTEARFRGFYQQSRILLFAITHCFIYNQALFYLQSRNVLFTIMQSFIYNHAMFYLQSWLSLSVVNITSPGLAFEHIKSEAIEGEDPCGLEARGW